ncbi:MAG: dehydrogenase [Thermodesulfobacteriota bacterium]|nr:dehydrogenase [Thermodesulfobacteriota bacterium]
MVVQESLTFDDVFLVPCYSELLPSEVDVQTRLTNTISLKIPIVSAAMDTVTESEMAISLARQGGIGIIHRNLSIPDQVREVDRVKRSESGMIVDPITIHPDQKILDALQIMKKYHISGVPVTVNGYLKGILTNRDLRFVEDLDLRVEEVMTKDNLVTVDEKIGIEESKALLHKHRIEKLVVVDKENRVKGLITIKDIQKAIMYPNSAKDAFGRLRVGAGVGVGADREERVEALIRRGVDVIVVDTSHGHSKNVMDTIREIKTNYENCQVIGGNIATSEAVRDLVRAGADGVKLGVGPGSICTTRIVAGVGVPQISAILECSKVAAELGIPMIADGGIKFSGDVTKALAAGADTIMVGGLLAGTDESPGETVLYQGRSYKSYRGMGSLEAMREGSRDRYGQHEGVAEHKLVPEGIVGMVPAKGPVADSITQLIGGLKAGMGYLGASTLSELRVKAKFVKVTSAGLKESHVHDVVITKEAPNYRRES